ncbi:polysaccharide biosynthesis protein [Halomonas mongoliensis]|uniref:polysaccharide biosynthesis protein n=1 Tax=Halomonas mongoliensis TaxID=321265 RepID=UPI00403ACEF1
MSLLLQRAFRLPRRVKSALLLMADVMLLSTSLVLALVLKQDSLSPLTSNQPINLLMVSVPPSLLIFRQLGFYRALIRFIGQRALLTMALGVLLSTLVLWIVAGLLDFPLTASTLVIYAMLALLGAGGMRFMLRSLYRRDTLRPRARVMIYGAGAAGAQLVNSLRQGSEFLPVAYLDDWRGMHGTIVEGLKVYAPAGLDRLVNELAVDRILLAMPSVPRTRRREILASLQPLCIPVQTVPAIEDMVNGGAQINEIRDVAVEDLLGRETVESHRELLAANVQDKVVMVTGAGGSIGSELCRQILRQRPEALLLLELNEFSLYAVDNELQAIAAAEGLGSVQIKPLLGSVQHRQRLEAVMAGFGVQTVYHAAAYKHVPMVEYNVAEGVRNNVFGTLETARAAVAAGVETFVLVSTDKAVRPTNVMGTTKRLAELICQAYAGRQRTTRFCMVRFGNVLGSSGSVIPRFKQQIATGGPVTVTHPEMTRFFMTIPEAAELVLQAGAMGRGGDVFVLDMGEPVRIDELARDMIRLSGLEVRSASNPNGDIEIVYSGLRPGEKLFEEVLVGADARPTVHPRILTEQEPHWAWEALEAYLERLMGAVERNAMDEIRGLLAEAPTAYRPDSPIVDLQWLNRSAPTEHPPVPAGNEVVPRPVSMSQSAFAPRITEPPTASEVTDEAAKGRMVRLATR